MTIVRTALLALFALPCACRQAGPPVTIEQRAALELDVYRALLAKEDVSGAEIMREPRFREACLPPTGTSPCWTRRVPRASAAALTEYLALNDTSHSLDPAILDTLRAEQHRSPPPAATGPPDEPVEIFLSRVGFDARGRTAVASIERLAGPGPNPGGGVRTFRTYLLIQTFGHFAVLEILDDTTS